MILVSILNIIFQTINGTFYWGNIVVLVVFIFVAAYKTYKIHIKKTLSFVGEKEDPKQDDLQEDESND